MFFLYEKGLLVLKNVMSGRCLRIPHYLATMDKNNLGVELFTVPKIAIYILSYEPRRFWNDEL
jgi:hypothetical protein